MKSGLLLGFAALSLAVAGCGDDPAGPEPEAEPITLAAALAETGRHAGAGNDLAWGYRLAVDLLNETGGLAGRPVQLVIRDMKAPRRRAPASTPSSSPPTRSTPSSVPTAA